MWQLRRGQIAGRSAIDAPAAASYTGPGDIVSGALGWYSVARSYSAAYAATGGPMADLVDQAGANSITINVLTTGYVDLTAISNWVTANSVTTIRIAKVYDHSGGNRHLTQATLAQMPALVLNSLNGLPGIVATSARGDRLLSANITQAQPLSFSTVAKRTSGSAASGWVGGSGNPPGLYANVSTQWAVSGGTAVLATSIAENTFHAGQGVINGASSAINVDGVLSTAAGGSTGYSAAPISILRANGATPDGVLMEAGVWPSAFTTTATTGQCDLINANQHGLAGYNF